MNLYSHMIAVTNRRFFDSAPNPRGAFLHRVESVLSLRPRALVLREKDLTPEAYRALAAQILSFSAEVPIILHGFPQIAAELGAKHLHLPLPLLQQLSAENPACLRCFSCLGSSVHSVEDARLAVSLGVSYCFAGNIFETGCKPGLDGRGLPFLREVSSAVSVPVYGIGGVNEENLPRLLKAGAAGGCMMSGFFSDPSPAPSRAL